MNSAKSYFEHTLQQQMQMEARAQEQQEETRLRTWEKKAELGHRSWEKHAEWQLENFRAITAFSMLTMKMALTISSGGLVVLLAFLGQIWANDAAQASIISEKLRLTWWCFSGALIISLLAPASSYLAQFFYGAASDVNFVNGEAEPIKTTPYRIALAFHAAAASLFASAIALIAEGCSEAIKALSSFT